MATYRFAQGSLVQYGDGATPTESFTTVWGAKGIKLDGVKVGNEDVTNHSSAGGYIEREPTLKDPGRLSFDAFYDYTDTSHLAVKTLHTDKTKRNWQVVAPDGTTVMYRCLGFVDTRGRNFPEKNYMMMNLGVQMTGLPSIDL